MAEGGRELSSAMNAPVSPAPLASGAQTPVHGTARAAAASIVTERMSADTSSAPAKGPQIHPVHAEQRAMPGSAMTYAVSGLAPGTTFEWYCLNDTLAVISHDAPECVGGPHGTVDPSGLSQWHVNWAFLGTHTLMCRMFDANGVCRESRYAQRVETVETAADDTIAEKPRSLLQQQVGLELNVLLMKQGGLNHATPDAPFISVSGTQDTDDTIDLGMAAMADTAFVMPAHKSRTFNYALQNRDKARTPAARLRWYVRPEDPMLAKAPSLWGLPRIDVGGRAAFDLGSHGDSASFDIETGGAYTVECEGFDDNGRSIGVLASHRQVALDSTTEKKIAAAEKHAGNVEAGVEKIRPGADVPIRAAYVQPSVGESVPLSLYAGPSKEDPQRVLLLDLSPGAVRLEYSGVGLEGALNDFEHNNLYPQGGIIKLSAPSLSPRGAPLVREMKTTGRSDAGAVAHTAGLIAFAAGSAAFAAGLTGVGVSLAVPLLVVAAVAGATAGVLDLIEQEHCEVVSVKHVTLDLINIIGGLLEIGSILRVVKLVKARELREATAAERALYVVDAGMDATQLLLLQYDHVIQAEKILTDPETSRVEKIKLLAEVLLLNRGVVTRDDIVTARNEQAPVNAASDQLLGAR